jgi:spermidine synthase
MAFRFENTLRISLFTLGFSALATQLLLIRECFSVLNGNELVIGIVVANWMLLTGAGAYAGRFLKKLRGQTSFVLFIQFLFSLLPILMMLKLDIWKASSIPLGSIVGFIPVVRTLFLFQLPFCILNGFLFVALIQQLTEVTGKNPISRSYAIESAGGIAAGIVVNLLILNYSGVYNTLRILLCINLLVCIIYSITSPVRIQKFLAVPVCLIFMILPFFTDLESYTTKLFYENQQLVFHKNTPYGKLDVTKTAGQLNFFENGLLLFSSKNEIANEESVHFAMAQHAGNKTVLLISGGISGTIDEIMKYNPNRIDYVELDPELIRLGKMFTREFDDKPVRVIEGDARRFIRRTIERYDVVLINLPEPSTLLINRFYTQEFFAELKRILNPDAVISESLPTTSDYVSKTAAVTNSILVSTLKSAFQNVMILPGQKNYFLASDGAISTSIDSLVTKREISTQYVNSNYLDESSLKQRNEYVTSRIDRNAGVNHDFRPLAFFQQIRYWDSMFAWNSVVGAIIAFLIVILVLASLNRLSVGLFTGGFTASSIELLIIISFQVIYGYVFIATGIIISLFMTGLAMGAFFYKRLVSVPSERIYVHFQIGIALFCIGFPFVITGMSLPGMPPFAVQATFVLLTLVISFLTGMEFSIVSVIGNKDLVKNTSLNYSADLFGSALGAIITTLLLLPFLGLIGCCIILAALNSSSAVFLSFRKKK